MNCSTRRMEPTCAVAGVIWKEGLGRHVEVLMRMSTDEYCTYDLTVIGSACSFSNYYRFKQKFSNGGGCMTVTLTVTVL